MLLLLIPFLLIVSFGVLTICKGQSNNTIFTQGAFFDYRVIVEENDSSLVVDTLRIEVIKPTLIPKLLGNDLALWTSKKYPQLSQKRGMNINGKDVELQMPTVFPYLDYELICVAPYPEYSETLKIGHTAEISHKYYKGYGKLAGVTLLQEIKSVDTVQTTINKEISTLKKTIGYNVSHVDMFSKYFGTYFFNEKLGFTRIIYKYPNNKTISLDLLIE